ncbi:DinB family protein [Bacillus sp. CECT 9360]|uniref:DinB family protein n=1 Tax=Bacillus sp. CECT 9360 TaxID=2845821 RepID=UPI001E3D1ACB|nr:DinB family protein [Bacillus sp. CECT 9360]
MKPIIGMLYSMVASNYERLKTIVADITQEELDYKGPNQKYNSIAQLIRHLAYVDLNWVFRIKGDSMPKSLEEKYGPMLDEKNELPFVAGITSETLLTEYDKVFRMLTAVCFQLTDNHLNNKVEYEDGKEATVRWGIWHMADHNRYHQAHINQLRKLYKEET